MPVAWMYAIVVASYGVMSENPDEAQRVTSAVEACVERETLDPVMVLSVIGQESSFYANPCAKRARLDRILSREPVEDHPDREVISWTCGSANGTRPPCERTVWQVEERDGYLYFDTCPAGEMGYMQVLRSSEYAQAGYPIPGTEFDASGQVDGALRCFVGNTADPDRLRLAVTLNGERLPRSAFSVEDVQICLDEAPAVGSSLVFAAALSTENRVRREQLLDARINIALGCDELADHRESAPERKRDPWWRWIGAYNAGTTEGDAALRYRGSILRRYVEFCGKMVTVEGEGENANEEKPLREVWEGCAPAEEALEEWYEGDEE